MDEHYYYDLRDLYGIKRMEGTRTGWVIPGGERPHRSALQAASENGHLDVVRYLIHAGADVNTPAAKVYGRTALQAAAGNGHLYVVKHLLAAGAEVNAPAGFKFGLTALQAAVVAKDLPIVEILLHAGAATKTPPGGPRTCTALHMAARGGHLTIVEQLLDAGADANAIRTDLIEATVLGEALEGQHAKVVDVLLDAGADVHGIWGERGSRYLAQAECCGLHSIVRRLIVEGVAIDEILAGKLGLLRVDSEGSILSDTRQELETAVREGYWFEVDLVLTQGETGPRFNRSTNGTVVDELW